MNFQDLKIKINKIKPDSPEMVTISCYEVDDDVKDIITFVRSKQGQLTGTCDGEKYEIPVKDIFYIESVDNRTFLYTSKDVYKTDYRIYELEDLLRNKRFLRIQKAAIVNLMKIKSIKPSLNGRFIAVLTNGEEIIISRKYVPELKKTLKGAE